MISIKNLTKSFGDNVIFKDVNLEIDKGEAIVIIGGSGCGKSTLLRCINKLTVPDCGEILIDGEDILANKADVDKIRRRMGMVYQQFNLFSHLNTIENVMLAPMKLLGMNQEDAMALAEKELEKVGMSNFKYQMPDSLSGGQKQRVAIARTLAMNPEIILFDEPTSALDPTMVDEVENVIQKLVDEGITAIIVTHEMRFAKSIASKVIFLAEKGIYETGSPKDFFDNPQKPLTREFLYKRRMIEAEFGKDEFDPIELRRVMNNLMKKFEHSSKQMRALAVIMDELIYPVFDAKPSAICHLRLLCSEMSDKHMLIVRFDNADNDYIKAGYLDELSIKLLEAACRDVVATDEGITFIL